MRHAHGNDGNFQSFFGGRFLRGTREGGQGKANRKHREPDQCAVLAAAAQNILHPGLDDFNKCRFSCQTRKENNKEMLFLPFLDKKGAFGKTIGIKKVGDL
jgi:hypothetical protein